MAESKNVQLKIDDIVRYDMNNSSLLDVVEDASTVGLFSSNKIIILAIIILKWLPVKDSTIIVTIDGVKVSKT